MEQPLVSVIMGVYNCEKLVSQCIESIINQTYENWEFIICDDCSVDHTLDILKKYEAQDNRIKIIKNETNMRLAASLNHCLRVSKGVYIARMDDDDISMPDRFEKQVEFLNTHNEYAVVGTSVKISDGESIIGERHSKEYPQKNNVLFGPTFMHPTIMMRKSVYDTLNGYTVASHTNRGQDWDLWFRFYAEGFVGYNLQETLLIYHESPDDYKKRTFKTAIGYSKTAFRGYELLHVPFWKYIYAFKPIASYFIPESVKRSYRHENVDTQKSSF